MSGSVLEMESRAPRTNMFIAAALLLDGVSAPVTIRNLSTLGALIETPCVTAPAAPFSLQRGSLIASGTVAWSTKNRCGLRFESPVSVRDWMAPPANSRQAQVDATIAQIRSGGLSLSHGASHALPPGFNSTSSEADRPMAIKLKSRAVVVFRSNAGIRPFCTGKVA